MNKYETIILIKDNITEEQRNKVINTIEDYINTNGTITKLEELGIKVLAYEIKEHKKAYYYLIEFDAESKYIAELERIYRITDEILKFIVVKKERND